MKKLAFTALMLVMYIAVYGQITRPDADSLLNELPKHITDAARINTLLKLAEYNILKPGEYKADLDSAVTFINQAKAINNKLRSTDAYGYAALVESYLARDRHQDAAAKAFVENAVELLSKTTNYYELGQAYYLNASYYAAYENGDNPIGMVLMEKGIQAFKKARNIEREAYGYRMLGEADPDVKTCLEKLEMSLSLYKSIHYEKLQGVYDLIAIAYLYDLNLQKALPYELLALKTAEKVQDTTMQLCEINNHLGIIFYKKRDFTTAALYFLNALKTAEAYKDIPTIYVLSDNITNSYINDKKPLAAKNVLQRVIKNYPVLNTNVATNRKILSAFVKIYTALGQISQGRPYAARLADIDITDHDKLINANIIDDNLVITKFYLAAKEYSSAAAYLNKNEEIVNKYGIAYDRVVSNDLWFKLDTAQKDYKSAVIHLLKLHKVQDSIFNQTKEIEFHKQQVQYETEKKTQQIQLLQKNDLLQQANLKRADLVRNITIGGIVVMILVSALFYRNYRQKQKANNIITHKNELLQHLLTEKEWLLKEVHHRVKNNLHTVICLLESQARYLENDALKAIENSQHRIYAMSLIHQKLYQSDDIKTIDMSEYIPELVKSLEESFDTAGQIKFSLKIDPVSLDISHAIPLGLIINEAVTNSIKYAFPNNRIGEIAISMLNNGGRVKLELADNGIGMAHIDHEAEPESLGLRLMRGLSEDIDADISFKVDNGTRIRIIFKPDALNEPENIARSPGIKEGLYA